MAPTTTRPGRKPESHTRATVLAPPAVIPPALEIWAPDPPTWGQRLLPKALRAAMGAAASAPVPPSSTMTAKAMSPR